MVVKEGIQIARVTEPQAEMPLVCLDVTVDRRETALMLRVAPGIGLFSRYAKVLGDDDSVMSVRMALSLVNRVWEEIESELDTNSAPGRSWHWRGLRPTVSTLAGHAISSYSPTPRTSRQPFRL
jgi:hypothetical protein